MGLVSWLGAELAVGDTEQVLKSLSGLVCHQFSVLSAVVGHQRLKKVTFGVTVLPPML